MADWSTYNQIVALLYLTLACAAAFRLARKLYDSGCAVSAKTKHSILVLAALVVYAIARAVQLLLEGFSVVPRNGTLENHFYTSIPATFLLLLQSAFVAKWVQHVSELTLVLQSVRFRLGAVAVYGSLGLCAIVDVTTVAAIIGTRHAAHTSLTDQQWNAVITLVCGIAFAANGVIFIGLGVVLRSLWDPTSAEGITASRRILGIAVLFGLMCCARGIILSLYSMESYRSVESVTHAGWGAPTVLVVEWAGICATLYLLTVQRQGGANGGAGGSDAVGEHDGTDENEGGEYSAFDQRRSSVGLSNGSGSLVTVSSGSYGATRRSCSMVDRGVAQRTRSDSGGAEMDRNASDTPRPSTTARTITVNKMSLPSAAQRQESGTAPPRRSCRPLQQETVDLAEERVALCAGAGSEIEAASAEEPG